MLAKLIALFDQHPMVALILFYDRSIQRIRSANDMTTTFM